eukprot:CAMPEP_0114559396 /NCGR_PEP_ID=MMETSP0114-20121206/10899_1 /TAXON_ID=31324 /ORGANISM="Goniomonas sp, Strain m" /LENGTH=647 /DNA_ID=CAMNT_0001744863 /DNA_START=32 /DNA_END=1975 /DNA_ORIENTATION=+
MNDIQRIVLDIVQQCERKRTQVPETLAAFIAKAVILENTERFRLDRKLYKADVDALVELAVSRLTEKDSPKLETLKMQVAFDSAYVQQHDTLEEERTNMAGAYGKFEKDVCTTEAQSPKDVAAFNTIQTNIIGALLRRTNQDPDDLLLQREVAAALESVLPRANLYVFSELSFLEKKARMLDLHDYVLGIRLFNHRIGKGGIGLTNAPEQAVADVHELASQLAEEVRDVMQECQDLSDVIGFGNKLGADKAAAKGIPVERLQMELVNRRQYQSFLVTFQEEVGQALDKAQNNHAEFEHEMTQVQELVGRRVAVPKEYVYPKFAATAKAWTMGGDMVRRVKALKAIWVTLMSFREPLYTPALTSEMVAKARKTKTTKGEQAGGVGPDGEEKLQMDAADPDGSRAGGAVMPSGAVNEEGVDSDVVPRRITAEAHPEILELVTEFNGFCPVSFVDRDGLLLPGDPGIGNVLFKGRLYAFDDHAAVNAFVADPVKYIEGIIRKAHRNSELINLLGLDEHFPSNVLRTALTGLGEAAVDDRPPTQEAGVQTVMHVVEKLVDYKYDFNEWSLRRKALQLTNLRNKATHSSQTISSHFRREGDTQVWLPKEISTQTASSTGTMPIQKLRYLTGLRGHPDQITDVVYQEVDMNFR